MEAVLYALGGGVVSTLIAVVWALWERNAATKAKATALHAGDLASRQASKVGDLDEKLLSQAVAHAAEMKRQGLTVADLERRIAEQRRQIDALVSNDPARAGAVLLDVLRTGGRAQAGSPDPRPAAGADAGKPAPVGPGQRDHR